MRPHMISLSAYALMMSPPPIMRGILHEERHENKRAMRQKAPKKKRGK